MDGHIDCNGPTFQRALSRSWAHKTPELKQRFSATNDRSLLKALVDEANRADIGRI